MKNTNLSILMTLAILTVSCASLEVKTNPKTYCAQFGYTDVNVMKYTTRGSIYNSDKQSYAATFGGKVAINCARPETEQDKCFVKELKKISLELGEYNSDARRSNLATSILVGLIVTSPFAAIVYSTAKTDQDEMQTKLDAAIEKAYKKCGDYGDIEIVVSRE